MANKNSWNIGDIVSKQEYTACAIFCNANGTMHIEKQNGQYIVVANQVYVPTVQEQIQQLENSITARNLRSAIRGDEFALNKIAEVEAKIEELKKRL